jgi:hypothetical protein
MTRMGIELLTALISAHIVADFLLQNETVVVNKHRWWVMALHAMGAGATAYLACGLWRQWWLFAATSGSHWLLDRYKIRSKRPHRPGSFVQDQAAHLGVAVVLALVAQTTVESATVWPDLGHAARTLLLKSMVLISGLLLAGKVGGILVGLWVHPLLVRMLRETRRIARATPAGRDNGLKSATPTRGLSSAGRIIGQLERILIFMFVFAGDNAGVGFLVAAKSVFRFGELKEPSNRMEAEYILIGTLMSFAYGLVVAYAARWVWGLI